MHLRHPTSAAPRPFKSTKAQREHWRVETRLARRSDGQERVHQRLLASGITPARLPAGQKFVEAVQAARPAAAACSEAGYKSMLRIAALAGEAAQGLTLWWQHPGQLSFNADGQWGIFGHEFGGVKSNFIYKHTCDHARRQPVRTVCELGFMAGQSATMFLEALPEARVVSFDLGDCEWTRPQGDLLRAAYGPRFELVLGLSNFTAPRFAAEHPDLRCDVLFVDGAKFTESRWSDLLNFRRLTQPGAALFYDEVAGTVK